MFYKCLLLASLSVPFGALAKNLEPAWSIWFEQQVQKNANLQAAKQQLNNVNAQGLNLQQPLYNPELVTEYEREGDNNNYRIGFNQTVDFWDKRGDQTQVAKFNQVAAEQSYTLTEQEIKAQALQNLIQWQSAKQTARITATAERQLQQLLKMIKKRQDAGDLGQIDAQLAFLNLSQEMNTNAQAQVQLKQAEAIVREVLPDWTPETIVIPNQFWQFFEKKELNTTADLHPRVLLAKNEWLVQEQLAILSQTQTKADPTFGLNAGKEGDENVVGVTFSMPLNLLNDYSAQVESAQYSALSARSQFQAIKRQQQFAIETSHIQLEGYYQQLSRWQSMFQGRTEHIGKLLKQQWESGDINTAAYLLALQQQAEALVSGLQLQSNYQQAYVEWLLATAQINTAISLLN